MSDLIEREYLLNIAKQEEAYGYVSEHEILNAPTAEPKVGKWIKNEHGLKCCSVCGERPLEICYYDLNFGGYMGKDILSKYCPHCGAKMERSE